MPKLTIRDIDVDGKRVIVRADFNVTFLPNTTTIADDSRIKATLPTIQHLRERNARVILCSHLGRPKGFDNELRLEPIAQRLSQLIGSPIKYARDCIGEEATKVVDEIGPGDVGLLENLRFHSGEEKNDLDFAKNLSQLADIYVNDAFGTAHRSHASTEGITHFLPAVSGFLMEKEIEFLGNALENPSKPFMAVIGGAKVSDKITVLKNLVPKVNQILIGGGMAAAFLNAYGHATGISQVQEDEPDMARDIVKQAARLGGIELLLPLDVVVADRMDANAETEIVFTDSIPQNKMILDIGPRTREMYETAISETKTVLWNGPMGAFEYPAFSEGTKSVAIALANITANGSVTIIGGGSTTEAVDSLDLANRMTHVSTGGGASLEFLEGRELPGVSAIQEKV